jgi:hypothetical protein
MTERAVTVARYYIRVEFESERDLMDAELQNLAFACEVQVSDPRDADGGRMYAGIDVVSVDAVML